ncbi:unnamed protein product [Arctogadus glacialis]
MHSAALVEDANVYGSLLGPRSADGPPGGSPAGERERTEGSEGWRWGPVSQAVRRAPCVRESRGPRRTRLPPAKALRSQREPGGEELWSAPLASETECLCSLGRASEDLSEAMELLASPECNYNTPAWGRAPGPPVAPPPSSLSRLALVTWLRRSRICSPPPCRPPPPPDPPVRSSASLPTLPLPPALRPPAAVPPDTRHHTHLTPRIGSSDCAEGGSALEVVDEEQMVGPIVDDNLSETWNSVAFRGGTVGERRRCQEKLASAAGERANRWEPVGTGGAGRRRGRRGLVFGTELATS